MGPNLNLWLHLLAFAVYTGATVALLLICLPVVSRESDPARRARLFASMMRVYDPLSIGVLGIVIMTGAFNLTAYKAALRGNFFAAVGVPLAWKLGLTFVVVNVAAYNAFGIGHRIVRTLDFGEEIPAERLDAALKRLRGSLILALALTALIVWIALGMTPAVLPEAPNV